MRDDMLAHADGAPAQPRTLTRRRFLEASALGAFGLAGGGLLSACGSSQSTSTTTAAATMSPRRGGTIRLGTPGSSADTLNSAAYVTNADLTRGIQLYDTLTELDLDFRLQLALAEELTADSPLQWTVRLRQGATFHNGKPVTADDLMFSLQRVIKTPYQGSVGISMIDLAGMRKLDPRTVRIPMTRPNSYLPDELSQADIPIVPVGFDPKTGIGSGPFKLVSFSPGVESVMARNENYWRQPAWIDTLIISDYADQATQVNALMAGQLEMCGLAPTQIKTVSGDSSLRLFVEQSAGWEPIVMQTSMTPFKDVRVRQAMRLLTDRQQIIDSAYAGYATLGNDLFSPIDPEYASSLPQRQQNVDQAKSLLRSAGYPDLRVQLVTSALSGTLAGVAQVFAQQAHEAGVTVSIDTIDPTSFYGPDFTRRALTQDVWGQFPLETTMAWALIPGAIDNETGWNDSRFDAFIEQARQQPAGSLRKEIMFEAQKLLYETGGYVIPAQIQSWLAYRSTVHGFPSSTTATNYFNFQYRKLWVS